VSAPSGIAYKAYEIEEFVDVYFFRRLGILIAHLARILKITPNTVSIVSGLVGGAGGLLLLDDRWVPLGVTLIVAYGVFDSADGQLARLTGQMSEWGRVLDGLSGYVTHTTAYLAITVRMIRHDGSWWPLAIGILAGIVTALHAQLYDYHRTTYASIVVKGRPTEISMHARAGLIGAYERLQQRLAGAHPDVEAAIAARASHGVVAATDRQRYREAFYALMPGWNLFGDNMRRYGFIVLAWLARLEWYFAYILIPLNVVLVAMWLLQRRADRRFLAAIG
jgi:phosphatidylglycerophosphate synthase